MSVDPVVTRRFIESLSTLLEDHLATWKSSLADVKSEIENILTSASEKIPAQAKPLFPEDLVGMMLEDILPPPAPPAPPERIVERVVEQIQVPGAPDWTALRTSLAAIESAGTQVDVLTRFLTQAREHASRVALLVLRNDRLTGWKALGFDATGGHDEATKAVAMAADLDPFAAEVFKRERSILAVPPDESSPLRRGLGGRPPARTLLVPMVIRDRLAGVLLADEMPGDDGKLNEAALEVLTFVTGLSVDLLAARKKIPSPTLTPQGETVPRHTPILDIGATLRAPALSFPLPEPEPLPPAPMPPGGPRTEPQEGTDPGVAAKRKVRDAELALRALEESASYKKAAAPTPPPSPIARPAPRGTSIEELEAAARAIPLPKPLPPPAAAPAPQPPLTPLPTGEVTLAFEHLKSGAEPAPRAPIAPVPPPPPSFEPPRPAPPPPLRESPAPTSIPTPAAAPEALAGGGAQPLSAPAGFVPRVRLAKQDDTQRAIEDAKRLARLLVSEIKLYNERKVEEGRAAGDLYERLKDDIQRSRQVYEERTPDTVRASTDFFRDELVRILADGRAEALGPMA